LASSAIGGRVNDLYGLLFQKVLYPSWESGFRRRPTLSYLEELERSEWRSLDELKAFQARELRKLIEHAYNHSPHYRRTFAERGVVPSDIRTVDDLPKLPLLSRKIARDCFEERKSSAEPLPKIRKMTSGTSGLPLDFAYDLGSEYWRQATKLRGYAWAGYRPGDCSLHFWGSIAAVQKPALKKRIKCALDHMVRREHYVDCSDHSAAALDKVMQRIRAVRPKVMVCYAQAGAALARHVLETKSRDWEDISIVSAAERLFPNDREVMKKAFGPNVFETYGSREVMLIAAECSAHQGLHMSMENLVVELVVREGDKERPTVAGELGEVVITDLHNYGAPFIRYVNGDLAVAAAPGRCGCGRELSRLQTIEGRQTDTLRDGQGRPIGGMFFIVVFSVLADKVRGFQVVQRKDRSIDLKLVPGASFDDSLLHAVKRNCEKAIPGVDVRMHVVPEIPAGPGGKSRVVVVEN
jgi:phenylacetate-CoA ligase